MVKRIIKRIIGGYKCSAGRLFQGGPLIFAYHRFSNASPAYDIIGVHSNGRMDDLENEIIFLRKNFEIVSFKDFINSINNKENLRKMALLTFDDGYKDNYDYAYPVLKKYEVPATLFISCNIINNRDMLWFDKLCYIFQRLPSGEYLLPVIGKKFFSGRNRRPGSILFAERLKALKPEDVNSIINYLAGASGIIFDRALFEKLGLYLTGEEIKQMHSDGIRIGSHGISHCILNKVAPDEAKKEMQESRAALEALIGDDIDCFSYPDGGITADDAYLIKLAGECGYKIAVTTNAVENSDFSDSGLLRLGRICGGQDFFSFRYNLSRLI